MTADPKKLTVSRIGDEKVDRVVAPIVTRVNQLIEASKTTNTNLASILDAVNVAAYATPGVDQRENLQRAVDAAIAAGKPLFFPSGDWYTEGYLKIFEADGLLIYGEGGSQIFYRSQGGQATDGIATSTEMASSAFIVKSSTRVTFRGLTFRGATTGPPTTNLGACVYANSSSWVSMESCFLNAGGRLFCQDDTSSDYGTKLIGCTSYAARNACRTGDRSLVTGCIFEQPDTTDFDHTGSGIGSSHGLYFFAGRNGIVVDGNIFKNIRIDSVKFSGSSSPIRNAVVSNNLFDDCACGVMFGADDTNQHDGLTISGNVFQDCGTNRAGWLGNAACDIEGSRAVVINANTFVYTRHAVTSLSSVRSILAGRFAAGTQPCEFLTITNNSFVVVDGITPSLVATQGVYVTDIGDNNSHGGVRIQGNMFAASVEGVHSDRCVGLEVLDNTFSDLSAAIVLNGDRMPVVRGNRILQATSSNAQIRFTSCSFPIEERNVSIGGIATNVTGRVFSVSGSGSTVADHPLLGTRGKIYASDTVSSAGDYRAGAQEVVLAFGTGWTSGDTIDVNGAVTFTYRPSSPGANEFTTFAQLITLFNTAGYGAVDYGFPWGITTNHMLITDTGSFYIKTTTTQLTCGVLLKNGTGGNVNQCDSRGGSGQSVIWSPLAKVGSCACFVANNAAAATLLAANSPYVATYDPGADLEITHGAIASTEEFRWGIIG